MAFPDRQNPLDWFTQFWNITLGKKVDHQQDAWLLGPIGKIAENSEQFIQRLATESGLSIQRDVIGVGLVDHFDGWGIPINASVREFYTKTSDYDLEVRSSWRPIFGSLGYLVAKLFSRRIQQLNLPHVGHNEVVAFKSEIIKLLDGDGNAKYTIWHRSLKDTDEVVFYGIYTSCRAPSCEFCIKAVFPLPRGNATVVFRLESDANGNLELLSKGKKDGEPGFYFLVEDKRGCLWKHFLPHFHESIYVSEGDGTAMDAVHSLTLWSFKVYRMTYRITKKQV